MELVERTYVADFEYDFVLEIEMWPNARTHVSRQNMSSADQYLQTLFRVLHISKMNMKIIQKWFQILRKLFDAELADFKKLINELKRILQN